MLSSGWPVLLVYWYAENKRNFPWRSSVHPYHTWICEVMSQQTTMAVVLPRYNQFLLELPNVNALAQCSEETLRALWSGLGYYARARNLQRGAQHVSKVYGEFFPVTFAEWLNVPGIGPYSASILSSVHAKERKACVDGNVVRVVSRLLAIQDVQKLWNAAGQGFVQNFVQQALDDAPHSVAPGEYNQALMELGATVCTKHQPKCVRCPLVHGCKAFAHSLQEACPPKKPRKEKIGVNLCALLVEMQSVQGEQPRYLLGRRGKGFLQKTVGLPLFDSKYSPAHLQELLQLVCESSLPAQIDNLPHAFQHENDKPSFVQLGAPFSHSITHHQLNANLIFARVPFADYAVRTLVSRLTSLVGVQELHWVTFSELSAALSSNLDRKSLAVLRGKFPSVKSLDCMVSKLNTEKLKLSW